MGLFDDLPDATSTGVSPALTNKVKQFEGFSPRAYGDYKQTSVGYGTRGVPGEVIDEQTATMRLNSQLARNAGRIDGAAQHFGLTLAPQQRDALISFDYNTGAGDRVLAQSGGDLSKLPSLMGQFVHVTKPDGTKAVLPGLVDRRNQEISMFLGQPFNAAPSFTQLQPSPDTVALGSMVPKETDISGILPVQQTAAKAPKVPQMSAGTFDDLPDATPATTPQGGFFDDLPDATATPQAGPKPEVGFLEAAGRTAGSALLSVPEFVNRSLGVIPYAADKAAEAITGQSPGWSQAYQGYMVDDLAKRRAGMDIKPGENLTTGGKLGAAVGPLARDLPLIAGTGGLAELPAGASVLARLAHGAASMAPTGAIAGMDKQKQVIEQGGSQGEALMKGLGSQAITTATGAVPMAVQSGAPTLAGRLLSRGVQGAAIAAPVGTVARQAEQLMDGQPVTGMNADDLISAVPMGVISAVKGGRAPAPREIAPQPKTAFRDLAEAEAAAQAANRPDTITQMQGDIASGIKETPDIYAGEKVPDIFADLPTVKREAPATEVKSEVPAAKEEPPAKEESPVGEEPVAKNAAEPAATEQTAVSEPEAKESKAILAKSSPKTYQEAQDRIDEILDELEGRGVDIFKLYDVGGEILAKSGYSPMPKELSDAYKIRDEIGKRELETNVQDVKSIIKNKTSESESEKILKAYAINETDVAGQYMASKYFASTVKSDPIKQAEKIAYILANERGEIFDELKDISHKTLKDAVDIVKALGKYLGIDHSISIPKQGEIKQLNEGKPNSVQEPSKRETILQTQGAGEGEGVPVSEPTLTEHVLVKSGRKNGKPTFDVVQNLTDAEGNKTLGERVATGLTESAANKARREADKAAGVGKRAPAKTDDGFFDHPLTEELAGRLMSASAAKRKGKAFWESVKSQYDDIDGMFADKLHQSRMYGGTLTPDKAAKEAAESGLLPPDATARELHAELAQLSAAAKNRGRQLAARIKQETQAEKEAAKAPEAPIERSESDVSDLSEDVSTDFLPPEETAPATETVLPDEIKAAQDRLARLEAAGRGDTEQANRLRQAIADEVNKNVPTIETNGEGNLIREADMPFSLTGEMDSTPTPAEIAAKEREAAQAEADKKAQGDLFAPKEEPTTAQKIDAWADQTLKEAGKRLNIGGDPTVMAAAIWKGSRLIQRGITDFAKWSKAMIDEFGDKVRPHLNDIFSRSHDYLGAEAAAEAMAAGGRAKAFQIAAMKARDKFMSGAGRIRDFGEVIFSQNAARFETLVSRVKDPDARKILQDLGDMMHTAPGQNRAVNFNTYHQEVYTKLNQFKTKLDRAFQPYLKEIEAMSPEEKSDFMSRVGQLLTQEKSKEVAGKFGKMLNDIRDLQAELLQYQRDAGIEMGERDNYLKRVINEEAVAKDPKTFVNQATDAYRIKLKREASQDRDKAYRDAEKAADKEGYTDKGRQEFIDKLKRKAANARDGAFRLAEMHANKKGLTGAERDAYIASARKTATTTFKRETSAFRLNQQADIEGFTAEGRAKFIAGQRKSADTAFSKSMKDLDSDASASANAYLTRILHSVAGVQGDGTDSLKFQPGNGSPKHTKAREFGPEADTLLRDFYHRDVQDILANQIHSAVQMSEFARRFGPNSEKWGEIIKQLHAKNVDPEILQEVRDIIVSQTGGTHQIASKAFRGLNDTISLMNLIGYMARSAYSSLSEPIFIAARSGKVRDLYKAYAITMKETIDQIKHADPSDRALFAQDLGFISASAADAALSSRTMMDTAPGNNWARKLGNVFMRRIGLLQFTEGSKVAANTIAQRHLNRVAEDYAAGRRINLVRRELRSLGIDDADHQAFSDYVRNLTKDGRGIREAVFDDSDPNAALYRRALTRFNFESIMEPSKADRPRPANNPVYRIPYGLMGYLYSFSRNVNTRMVGLAKEAIDPKSGYTASERLGLLKPAAFLPIALAAQYGLGELRDLLWNDPSRQYQPPKSLRSKIWMALSRANILGKWDFPFNVANIPAIANSIMDSVTGNAPDPSEGRRYQKDPATFLLGPAVGGFSEFAQSGLNIFSDKNSERTNTQERKAARTSYDTFIKPLFGAVASTPAVPPLLGAALIQAVNHPAVREAFVAGTAGQAMPPKGLGSTLSSRGGSTRGSGSRGGSSRGASTR